MERNNGQTIFLSVIGIATLLVAIIGATFAYFTTQTETVSNNANFTTLKVGKLTFAVGGISAENDDIVPGWSRSADITVNWTESDIDMPYTCKIVRTDDTNITNVYVKAEKKTGDFGTGGTANSSYTLLGKGSTGVTLVTDKINANTANGDKSFTYTLLFRETGTAQNFDNDAQNPDESGQTLTTTITCEAASDTTVIYSGNTARATVATTPATAQSIN